MFDIQQLIEADKAILLALNGSSSLFWDGFMWTVSSTKVWIPAGAMLLYILFKNTKWTHGLLIVVMMALVVALADQFASGLCKPYFHRFRPTQDPELMYLVDVVNGYRGGSYGFMSSHAANTFGFAMFVSLLMRKRGLTLMMFAWAAIPSFSRIYLGVHYPGDVVCGALAGCLIAMLVYRLYDYLRKKFFGQPQYVSDQYTASGFEVDDINLFQTVLLGTFFYVIVAAMLTSKLMNF